jgi:hypothetical protein
MATAGTIRALGTAPGPGAWSGSSPDQFRRPSVCRSCLQRHRPVTVAHPDPNRAPIPDLGSDFCSRSRYRSRLVGTAVQQKAGKPRRRVPTFSETTFGKRSETSANSIQDGGVAVLERSVACRTPDVVPYVLEEFAIKKRTPSPAFTDDGANSGNDLLSHKLYMHYHRSYDVSLPCSGWERVGPSCKDHQTSERTPGVCRPLSCHFKRTLLLSDNRIQGRIQLSNF